AVPALHLHHRPSKRHGAVFHHVVHRLCGQPAVTERDAEVLLLIKTDQRHLEAIERLFALQHPYDCPEFIALPVDRISERYAAWMSAEMQPANGGNPA
ncbi:MAG: divalent-cation tolerance protein CutA, partial [Chlorobiales bacterium]|nr:divalent-cation tolerance protein CutA [Chlorobiales bacterium]